VLGTVPDHADALQFLGIIYRESQPGLALQMVRRAAELNPHSPDVHYNLGVMQQQTGALAGALASYLRAVELRPDYFEALSNLALVYTGLDELREARAACERALRVRPDDPMVLNNLGTVLEGLGLFDDAIRCYERASARRPDYVEAMANLAQVLEKQHRLDDARTVCEQAMERDAGSVAVRAVAARLDLREGLHEQGLERLQGTDLDALPNEAAAAAWQTLGELCERLGRYEEAFEAYARGNRRMAGTPRAASLYRQASARKRLARLSQWFRPELVQTWEADAPADGLPRPIFLVGFPRSGTTLLDRMLSSHPDLYTLEEHQVLRDVIDPFLRSDAGLARLGLLREPEIRELRLQYWKAISRTCLGRTNKRFIIDKYPLNLGVAGVIQRIFPDARLVVAQRDPRDVCVSCFAQGFALNSAMVNFLTLADTVAYYAGVMGLWLRYDAALPMARAVVRYERLVQEPRAELAPVLDLLGVPWDDQVLSYADTALARASRTPSYARVTRPLDTSAVGRWRHFSAALAPYLSQLGPFVRSLGYADGGNGGA